MKSCKVYNAVTASLLACSLFISGCESRQGKASAAFSQYQAAKATGDLEGTRRALAALVAADDTQADYWIELGKVQLQLADLAAAYNSFERARELDPANASVLGILTQLLLRSGNLALAEEAARQLELVAPEDPAVRLTYGYVALRRGDLEEAGRQSELLLAAVPFDSSAKILSARVLLQSGRPTEAIDLLREQIRIQPSDQASLRAVGSIYEFMEQWPDAAWAARNLLAWRPQDQEVRAQLVLNELRAQRIEAARVATVEGLQKANPLEIRKLLTPWTALGTQVHLANAVFDLAREASGDRRMAFARFLARADRSRWVADLTREYATIPVTAENLAANALHGAALAKSGQRRLGLDRLNKVLAVDPANFDALYGRAEIRSTAGLHQLAIEDAQRLVAADQGAPEARLLLARITLSAKDTESARRTLWNAFHDIPAERSIYEALRGLVAKAEGAAAAESLATEFNDQRKNEMIRNFA